MLEKQLWISTFWWPGLGHRKTMQNDFPKIGPRLMGIQPPMAHDFIIIKTSSRLIKYSTCRWHGSCRTYPKNANSHVICKVKKAEKCISPVSSVKCLGKKNHMTWDLCIQKDAKHVMSTNSHTVHFTSHMNKDSILVHDYLLAVGIIQNNTSAVRIFQSHVNPFTSLFYLATI